MNAEKIPVSYKSNLVTCFEVLEHVKNDRKPLAQLIKFSNRYLIISVPAKQRLFNQSDVMAGHYRRYEKKALIKLLNDYGLDVISFDSYGYPYTNIIRPVIELVAKRKATKTTTSNIMEQRSKKSGVNLLDINRFFTSSLNILIKPMYFTSCMFNRFDFSEGYIIVATRK